MALTSPAEKLTGILAGGAASAIGGPGSTAGCGTSAVSSGAYDAAWGMSIFWQEIRLA